MITDIANLCVSPKSSIREVIGCIDRNRQGVALVVNELGHLLDTITDGDLRRAILDGFDVETNVERLAARRSTSPYPVPITAAVDTLSCDLLEQMEKHSIRQVPLIDDENKVVGLATMEELLPKKTQAVGAVIMAGGKGTRLLPLTNDLPKPMLPIGDRPILAHIIEQLRDAGIKRMNITTHYKPEKIMDYFGDGDALGVQISYLSEESPLGTAGALGLMERSDDPVLVINGDILTQVDFRAMVDFHRQNEADLTVAVRQYEFQVPYGVVECEGTTISAVTEKPSFNFFVNAGMYLLQPTAHSEIKNGEYLDMTDLIQRLLTRNKTVVSFPVLEYWLDIGRFDDYERAKKDLEDGEIGYGK